MMDWYKLVDKVPVKCENGDYPAYEPDDRRICRTILPGGKYVSTVFLGLDHAFDGGDPLLFETMVFSEETGLNGEDMDRYVTYEEAVQGHRDMVEKHGGRILPTDFFDDDLFEL